jgi:uncharacterized Zn finger protein
MQITIEKMHCPQCTESTAFEVLRYRPGKANNRTTLRCVGCGHVFGVVEPKEKEFVGLELAEMDAIIDGNVTITDPRLRDGVYGVVLDTMTTLMEKNT